jgi:nitrate/TMAO reductase-like tetraheme cytochrome c subunit
MTKKPNENSFYVFFILMLTGCFFIISCEQDNPVDDQMHTENSCVSCHMDKDKLKEIADPVEYGESTGEA